MVSRLLMSGIVAMAVCNLVSATEPSNALGFKVNSIDGSQVDLSKYQGKVVVIVNVASKCGLTPQYEGLQAMYEKYKDKGLVVLGFPCNQFGKQEPGSNEEIKQFCSSKYKVTFDLFDKVDVNGEKACDLYKFLTAQGTKPVEKGVISWNFEKFIIGKDGAIVARYSPRTAPDDQAFVAAIEKALGQ